MLKEYSNTVMQVVYHDALDRTWGFMYDSGLPMEPCSCLSVCLSLRQSMSAMAGLQLFIILSLPAKFKVEPLHYVQPLLVLCYSVKLCSSTWPQILHHLVILLTLPQFLQCPHLQTSPLGSLMNMTHYLSRPKQRSSTQNKKLTYNLKTKWRGFGSKTRAMFELCLALLYLGHPRKQLTIPGLQHGIPSEFLGF